MWSSKYHHLFWQLHFHQKKWKKKAKFLDFCPFRKMNSVCTECPPPSFPPPHVPHSHFRYANIGVKLRIQIKKNMILYLLLRFVKDFLLSKTKWIFIYDRENRRYTTNNRATHGYTRPYKNKSKWIWIYDRGKRQFKGIIPHS